MVAPNPDAGMMVQPVTIPVGAVFSPGDRVRDAYSGQTGQVDEDGNLAITPDPRKVMLLELDRAYSPQFTWDSATVYFAITDRFFNGNPANDNSYGRQKDGADEIGTWHGGDFAGLTEKLDYLEALGVNALWISAPYEQVHGWTGGGAGDFQHYAYHGYWALDFTQLDANFGTELEFRTFISEAHARGIRVVLDVVMNHPGYATGADLVAYLPEVIDEAAFADFQPSEENGFHAWNDLVDYENQRWDQWWGPRWIRAGFPGHNRPGQDDLKMSLSYLPDFITEDFRDAPLPVLLQRKTDTAAVELPTTTVRGYLVDWLSQWVRDYGVDGFRCDTAKHVEQASWKALKDASVAALREWKQANPADAVDDLDFWMTGEVFPHGVVKDAYFTDGGFDSLINFDFQRVAKEVSRDRTKLDALYAQYASAINTDPAFNVLSYISSHDTSLYIETNDGDLEAQYAVGTAMMLLPGGVQIFYGDETGRRDGPSGSDDKQGTRSDMNWSGYDPALLAHWQKLGQFRRNHPAVAAGSHEKLAFEGGYAFSRSDSNDTVMVVLLD